MTTTKSRFEEFKESAKLNNNYRQDIQANGSFEFSRQVVALTELQNKLNASLLKYLFGNGHNDDFLDHLSDSFVVMNRNLLSWLNYLSDTEVTFFILHELKTNKNLYLHTY